MTKTSTVVGRGVALVIGCTTFPTWNSYPGLFASLVTGNPVIVKPHPGAVLPLAITVQIAREVLAEAGHEPRPGDARRRGAAATASPPPWPPTRDVRIVDFTGSSEFGNWLEANARQAVVYTEKSGLNTVIVDSTDDYKGLLRNLAFSLSLYSGQMCTTPQNLLVPPAASRPTPGTAAPRSSAPTWPPRSTSCSATRNARPARSARSSTTACWPGSPRPAPRPSVVPPDRPRSPTSSGPSATIRTPVVVRLRRGRREGLHPRVVRPGRRSSSPPSPPRTASQLFVETVRRHGALTASVYSTSPEVLAAAREAALDAGVHLSENLTGGVFVNQTAAFSDLHGTGANPAATASLTDDCFVTGRFFTLQSRHHVPAGGRECLRPILVGGVRTPQGKYGGALAGVRPDDLAALVVARGGAPRRGARRGDRRGRARRGQPGRRGQPQRRPDGRAAGRPARHRPRLHGQPAVRERPDRDRLGRAGDPRPARPT